MVEKKTKDTGEIVCGFLVRKDYEGQKDFDQTYKEVTIKRRVKKIGDGDEDFIIEEFEDVKETPIREVIDAQVDSVGIDAFMKPYLMAGEEPPFVGYDDINKAPIQDVSQFPDDGMLSQDAYSRMMETWETLDPALKGSAKTPEEFLKSFTQEKFNEYILSKLNVEKGNSKDDK